MLRTACLPTANGELHDRQGWPLAKENAPDHGFPRDRKQLLEIPLLTVTEPRLLDLDIPLPQLVADHLFDVLLGFVHVGEILRARLSSRPVATEPHGDR